MCTMRTSGRRLTVRLTVGYPNINMKTVWQIITAYLRMTLIMLSELMIPWLISALLKWRIHFI